MTPWKRLVSGSIGSVLRRLIFSPVLTGLTTVHSWVSIAAHISPKVIQFMRNTTLTKQRLIVSIGKYDGNIVFLLLTSQQKSNLSISKALFLVNLGHKSIIFSFFKNKSMFTSYLEYLVQIMKHKASHKNRLQCSRCHL